MKLGRYLPLLLLALALSSLFALRGERGYLYHLDDNLGNEITTKNLALAENLSLEHRLRLVLRRYPAADDEPGYKMYSRFPLGGYALIKLAALPFSDDLSTKLASARMVMLALYCAAAMLAFHTLCQIMANRWAALGATLLAFSSYRMLFYSDTVATELSVDLFAVMLAFHGMTIYVQKGGLVGDLGHRGFGQLVAKTCVALLLGWHVYGLLLAFVSLGLVADLVGAWSGGASDRQRLTRGQRWLKRLGTAAAALVRSRFLAIGAVALLFGTALLGANMVNEYATYGGEVAPSDLPTVRSMLSRTGLQERSAPLEWGAVLQKQLQYVGASVVPFAVPAPRNFRGDFPKRGVTPVLVGSLGALATITCLVWLLPLRLRQTRRVCEANSNAPARARLQLLLGTLVLSGFCWALPMRHHTTIHDYESVFYVGVPLVFFAVVLEAAKRWCRGRIVVGAALLTMPVFGLSCWAMATLVEDAEAAQRQKAFLAEFSDFRAAVRDKTVFVATEGRQAFVLPARGWALHQFDFLLAGSLLQFDTTGDWPHVRGDLTHRTRSYDFIVTDKRLEQPGLLTPDNRFAFLYDGTRFASVHEFFAPAYQAEYDAIAASEPAARAEFDLYLRDGQLSYLKAPCTDEDTLGLFFLHVVPKHLDSLPTSRREHGFDNRDFRFVHSGVTFNGTCMAHIPLPSYDLLSIGTGRVMPDGGQAWRTDIQAASI